MRENVFRRSLSRAVRRARRERGLTQRVLAEGTGITEKYLSRIELGQVTPSALVAFRLCTTLGTDLTHLMNVHTAPERRGIRAIARILHRHSERDIDRARRILVELFR